MILVDKEKIWVKITIIIVAVILATLGAVIVFEAHQYYQKVPEYSYYVDGGYTVMDNLNPNLLYNQTSIDNPSIIYNSITNSVNFSLFYDIQLSNMSQREVTIVNTVMLVSANPQWSKIISVNITDLKNVQKQSLEIPIQVNMSEDLILANNIDSQIQGGNSVPTLAFNMSIQVAGVPQFNTTMNIELHGTSEILSYGASQAVSSTQYQNELIVPQNIIGLNRDFGYVFFGSAGALAVYFAYLYAPRTNDPVKRILRDHGEQIIEIKNPVGDGATKIEKLEDLLKLSEIFEVPVFLYDADKVLYLNHQSYQYYYEII